MLATILVLLPGTALPSACSEGNYGCTDAGCQSEAIAEFPLELVPAPWRDGPLRVRVCVDGRCGRWQPRDGTFPLSAYRSEQLAADHSYRIRVDVVNGKGRLVARAIRITTPEVFAPNGEECGPICQVVDVRVTRADLVVG